MDACRPVRVRTGFGIIINHKEAQAPISGMRYDINFPLSAKTHKRSQLQGCSLKKNSATS
jgi:hypothetical protein